MEIEVGAARRTAQAAGVGAARRTAQATGADVVLDSVHLHETYRKALGTLWSLIATSGPEY
jgi:hypothetical protein